LRETFPACPFSGITQLLCFIIHEFQELKSLHKKKALQDETWLTPKIIDKKLI
jgi:hypothetical protein